MLINNRIIFSDNGVLNDKSKELSSITSGTVVLPIVATQDYIYMGSDLPFNHRHFEVKVANANSSLISVDIWDGSAWIAAVDVIDLTNLAGKCFAQSGIISWVTDRNSFWGQESTTENIAELSTLKIYNMYWARLKFSADLSISTELKYVGHKFSNDEDLFLKYPDLATAAAMTTFTAGKTNWSDQHILAAEEILMKLRKDRKIMSANQVFNWELFGAASVHKCAEIIFNSFGDDYKDNKTEANKEYHKSFNGIDWGFDTNGDGKIDDCGEKFTSSGLFRV